MAKYTRFSARASLAAIGVRFRQMGIWDVVKQHVTIKQKVLKYQPLDKLLSAFINILAGGTGLVEINTRVRPDAALLAAFGPAGCADQSTISATLNACTPETVQQMHTALQTILRQHGRTYAHDYAQWQLLDVDMTGLPSGKQGEQATKGYFAGQKNRYGRQVGRVLATRYAELVYERLYPGTMQLEKSLPELLTATETVLALDDERRRHTLVRCDGGGGSDSDINWLMDRGYGVLTKIHNWQRTQKLVRSVATWQPDPKISDREAGWVTAPHSYAHPTQQLGVRYRQDNGEWHYEVLIAGLCDEQLFWLADLPQPAELTPKQRMGAILQAYDLRGGGVETSNKDSKQGLHIHHRNKRNFAAQEMLLLLAQLAYNVTVWVRQELADQHPRLAHWGMLRMVRDLYQVAGRLRLGSEGQLIAITLNREHPMTPAICQALKSALAHDGIRLNWGEI
jgi:Transposase DDE domain group 1